MPVPKPTFDTRQGPTSAATTRLFIIGSFCAFQYWLLTVGMEAAHLGRTSVAWWTFVTSGLCFALAAGLLISGERGARRLQRDLRQSKRN